MSSALTSSASETQKPAEGRKDMERNFNDTFGGSSDTPNVGGSSGQSGSAGAGGTGFESGAQRADTSFSGAPGSMGAGSATESASTSKLGKAKEKIGERAGELK